MPPFMAKAGKIAIIPRNIDPGNTNLDIKESINSDVFLPGLTPGMKEPFRFYSSAI